MRPAQLTATNGPRARFEVTWICAGDDVLADTALAGDEDFGVAGRGAMRQTEDFKNLRAAADNRSSVGGGAAQRGAFQTRAILMRAAMSKGCALALPHREVC